MSSPSRSDDRRIRDRRGRGPRGPVIRPAVRKDGDPRSPYDVRHPVQRTDSERFDAIAISFMQELWRHWPEALGDVELAVEEVPMLPETWHDDSVPLSTYVAAQGRTPARLVLLRRPIEHRAEHRDELRAMIQTVLIDQVAEILGVDPDEVHPGFESD